MVVCNDNYPDWSITLRYEDGTDLALKTHGSNIYHLGGPWWVEIDGQLYIQVSDTILSSLHNLIEKLELPVGEPAGMYCFGLEQTLLDLLYGPDHEDSSL
jgi:hypothetical protein